MVHSNRFWRIGRKFGICKHGLRKIKYATGYQTNFSDWYTFMHFFLRLYLRIFNFYAILLHHFNVSHVCLFAIIHSCIPAIWKSDWRTMNNGNPINNFGSSTMAMRAIHTHVLLSLEYLSKIVFPFFKRWCRLHSVKVHGDVQMCEPPLLLVASHNEYYEW